MAYSAGANAPAPVADAAAADAPVLKRMQLKGHKDSVLCLAADGANSRLASGSADGMCRLWDLRSFRSVRAAQLPGDGADSEVCGVSLSSARPHLLLAAGGRQVYGFDLRSEKVILKDVSSSAECSRDDINQVLIDSNGHLCAVAEDTGAVHLLDLNTWRVDRTLFGKSGHETNICSSVAWKPGRSWCLASGGLDAAVCFWQRSGRGRKVQMKPDVGEDSATATGPQLCNPPFVHSLAYLPDESLAAGLGDGTVALLDQTHSEISRLRGHSAAVAQVISAPFGLVSAGNDLQVVLWSTDPSSRLPLLQWRHHEKMNWLASAESRLMVAGLGNEIVVYEGLDR